MNAEAVSLVLIFFFLSLTSFTPSLIRRQDDLCSGSRPADATPSPLPFFPTEPRSPFRLLRAAASTSVSALSSHRIWPHTLCDFVTANMCVCFRQRVKKSGKICVHLCANMRVCLLCFMYDIDNLEATGGRDLEKKEGARSLAWTMWGRWVSGNAISFWSSSSSKQTLWAMPPG